MSSVFCGPFLSFSFWDSCSASVSAFDVAFEVSQTCPPYLPVLSPCSVQCRDLHSVFSLTGLFRCITRSALDSFQCVSILIVVFISGCSLYFLTLLLKPAHSFLSSLIIFTVIALIFFSGGLPVSASPSCVWSFVLFLHLEHVLLPRFA